METITIEIDGIEITVDKGTTVLEAARSVNLYIPVLCSHPYLEPGPQPKPNVDYVFYNGIKIYNEGPLPQSYECGLCVVEVEGQPELELSCWTYAEDGMVVTTNSDRIKAARQDALAKYIETHPHDCQICTVSKDCSLSQCSEDVAKEDRCCDKFHNCEFLKMAQYVGIKADTPAYQYQDLPIINDEPLIIRDYNLCVSCTRCVKACRDLRGIEAIGFINTSDGEALIGTLAPTLKDSGCRYCGTCIAVCPTGALMDKDIDPANINQATLVPCSHTCPAGIDVPRYIRYITEGKPSESLAVIREKVPFPSVLGRICSHPCEDVCRRSEVNEPMSICSLKRYAADNGDDRWKQNAKVAPSTGKSVAVVGSGPSGLTTAYYLAKKGHAVTIYESLSQLGGMMRVGIPDYRLPRDVLDRDIDEILSVGIKAKTSTPVDATALEKMKSEYDAVYIGTGSHKARPFSVDGVDLDGVYRGVYFLRDNALGKLASRSFADKNVVVIGGGNTAIDCARSAVRLGAAEVSLTCIESSQEMPAHQWEIYDALDEGVRIYNSLSLTRINGEGRVSGIDFIRCTSVFDGDGNYNPTYDQEQSGSFECDVVIISVGEQADLSLIEGTDVQASPEGLIQVDNANQRTTSMGVFASGEVASGPASVIDAIAAGRKAAESIDKYLGGNGDISETLLEYEEPDPRIGFIEDFADLPRAEMPCLDSQQCTSDFSELATGFDETTAMAEAQRCLQCDLRLKISDVPLPPEK
ncbi:MAG: FAD-dependent oxidoreductase [Chloroflexi bacterium]|jgi:formate dehydrogenase (NADP+) beta subunit|nr:FAD-dependent oxidoreductase [Chloroflexota bacterium]MBT7081101.1 FAD-dependent oxidoreductase [Chloroflexota bacterium]MBT7289463.1 FAD-dependent oxidoreductase [Chloroflexota bacterium]